MQTIYLDVLLVLNLYIDCILLLLTARLTHSRLRVGRGLLAAVLGSCSSLMLFLPPMPAWVSVLLRLLTAGILCLTAFGWQNAAAYVWRVLCFLLSSFLMAGIFLALSLSGMVRVVHSNACWYLDVSLLHLILFTIAAYLLLTAVQRMYERLHTAQGGYRVQIRYGRCTASLQGLSDTGNSLTDFLTGKPVIICDRQKLGGMVPDDLTKPVKGYRLLPYRTVAGDGMLAVFRPDEIVIYEEENGTYHRVDALIGIGDCENKRAIFNPKVL